jgi:hypothetical protein
MPHQNAREQLLRSWNETPSRSVHLDKVCNLYQFVVALRFMLFTYALSLLQLKAAEAGMTLDRGGNMQASTELLLANGDITPTNHTGTNGSIITMTLKNNHLIVETEERNVSEAEPASRAFALQATRLMLMNED